MFVGHLSVGLLGKRIEPRISLGTWMLAALLADRLFFTFLIAGFEHVGAAPGVTVNRFLGDVPYSHSLLMGAIWGGLFAAAYWMRRHYLLGALLLFAAAHCRTASKCGQPAFLGKPTMRERFPTARSWKRGGARKP